MNKKSIIITLIILIVITGLTGLYKFTHRIKYNTNYVNGNSAGNLYNAGLFCESNGTIFFANPDDHNRLYSMNATGGDLKKLCNDTAMYINADDNYVYYVRDNNTNGQDYSFFSFNRNSLCRISRNGGSSTLLDPDPCIYATLIGNYIYYLHYDTETATTLYKVGIDGKDRQQVNNSYLFTCSALDKYFYYNSPENGELYRFDTTTDQTSAVYSCNCYKPIVLNDNNVYYLDVSQKNALVHTNIQSDNPTTLSTDFIELYNVYGSYIYYQRGGENPALCMIKNDGSDFRELASGEFSNINVTSSNIYFSNFKTGETLYTSTSNPGKINSFSPGTLDK